METVLFLDVDRIKLNWRSINHVQSKTLQSVLDRHQEVLNMDLGTIKEYEAKICGRPTLFLYRYPIPKIKDLLTQLAGGKSFTKLDMSQAYQQLLLEEESKKYTS